MNIFRDFVVEFCHNPELGTADEKIANRMKVLVAKPSYERYTKNPLNLIMAGFGTASDLLVTLFAVIEPLYESQYGDRPTPEQFRNVAGSVESLAQYMATIRLDLLGRVLREMRQNIEGVKILATDNFELREREGKYHLEIKREVLKKIALGYLATPSTDLANRKRTGCPALYAHGTEGKGNVISEMYGWYYSMVNEHYLKPREEAANLLTKQRES